MALRAAREPGTGDRAQTRLRDVLVLHPAFHPFAVLRLRLRVRRLPGEFAVWGLRALERWVCRALSLDARSGRIEILFRAACAIRPRCQGSGLLEDRPLRDRTHDQRTGNDGIAASSARRARGRDAPVCSPKRSPIGADLRGAKTAGFIGLTCEKTVSDTH